MRLTFERRAARITGILQHGMTDMRIARFGVLALVGIALAAAALVVSAPASEAQMNGGSFRALIASLNADDKAAVGSHLAPDFSLTFTGGTTVTGDEGTTMLLLLDTPIDIISVTPGSGSKGSAVITFGNAEEHYTIAYTGARGGKFATWIINAPSE